MIEKVQTAMFEYISEFLANYGIPNEFRYSEDLDLLTEYRRSINLRAINNKPYNDLCKVYYDMFASVLKDDENLKLGAALGLFSRTPLRRSKVYGNNATWNLRSNTNNIDTAIKFEDREQLEQFIINPPNLGDCELRQLLIGEIDYNISLLFDNIELCDIFELVYAGELSDLSKSIHVTYNFGDDLEPLEEVPYSITFSSLNTIGKINDSNLRQVNFTCQLRGPFFSPFYKDEKLIFTVDLDTHVFPKDKPIDSSVAFKPNQPSRAFRTTVEAKDHIDTILNKFK